MENRLKFTTIFQALTDNGKSLSGSHIAIITLTLSSIQPSIMKQVSQSFFLCTLMLVLSSCTGGTAYMGTAPSGTADGFGGGRYEVFLQSIRDSILLRAAEQLEIGNKVSGLCSYSACVDQNNHLCRRAPVLNKEQKNFCKDTLLQNLVSWKDRLRSKEISFQGVDGELVSDSGLSVIAKTALAETGTIEVSKTKTQQAGFSNLEYAALLTHEFYHKVKFHKGSFLKDTDSIGPFSGTSGGETLLTAMGLAVALYAQELGLDLQNDPNATATVSLSPFPEYHFGVRIIGSLNTETIAVQNTGRTQISELQIQSPRPPFFVLEEQEDRCRNGTLLAPGASCKIYVRFQSPNEGSFTDAVSLQFRDGDKTERKTVTWYAIAKSPKLAVGFPSWEPEQGIQIFDLMKGGRLAQAAVTQNIPGSATKPPHLLAYDWDGDRTPEISVGGRLLGETSDTLRSYDSQFPKVGSSFEEFALYSVKPPLAQWPTFQGAETAGMAIGDITGDGKKDLILGAFNATSFQVYDGMDTTKIFQIALPTADNPQFGHMHLSAGDVNGDHFDDIVVSYTNTSAPTGLSIIDGKTRSLIYAQSYVPLVCLPAGHCRGLMTAVGDLDGDSIAEIIVGTPRSFHSNWPDFPVEERYLYDQPIEVRVYSFQNETCAPTAFNCTPRTYLRQVGGTFFPYGENRGGITLATGDVNADGRLDILVAPGGFGPEAQSTPGSAAWTTPWGPLGDKMVAPPPEVRAFDGRTFEKLQTIRIPFTNDPRTAWPDGIGVPHYRFYMTHFL